MLPSEYYLFENLVEVDKSLIFKKGLDVKCIRDLY